MSLQIKAAGYWRSFDHAFTDKYGEKMCTMVHASWLVAPGALFQGSAGRRASNDKFNSTAEGVENGTTAVVHTSV